MSSADTTRQPTPVSTFGTGLEPAELQNELVRKRYLKEEKVGEGTYAVVYVGKQIDTNIKIAIKKIKVGPADQAKNGIDLSAIREIKLLRELRHENIIHLLDVFSQKQNLNLVLEFLDCDLEMLIRDRSIIFSPGNVKAWMCMTLRGLLHCHDNFVLHRDLKPNNLLISPTGVLKLADFGLARYHADTGPSARMSNSVVTRWYRSPELLMGARWYGTGIDIWSVGCIFAELMLRVPYMASETDLGQLDVIFRALGTPTEDEWPDMRKLPAYETAMPRTTYPRQPLSGLFTAASTDALDLLSRMLTFDPRKRPTSRECLLHPYFVNAPRPTREDRLPRKGGGMERGGEVVRDLKRKADAKENLGGRDKIARKLVF
ncbi:hypothetical protein G7K_0625-t1 [Saitoella complicata NRRL Y-17804]|uniref:[RNA-polymerase]-subunit kinase n=1 Tax=Saitoella complicata (strain BCRC 22490 / CBS 7301 / JCM 7358 / NBRC 10748 / NRRL Y-17804) TaxID=698492 RepID=A0A0E9N9A5_SAICN|nr:hypothetical protein G7K_0625-t1 [Saitoella complicata NRRL Y-17804]